jgi:DMSO/TMAO reductase YedYZ molybdopterin-dependent catalytic subunit
MTRRRLGSGAFYGALASVLAMAVLALTGAAFAPYDLFELLTRALPGRVITLGIDTIVSVITWLGVRPTAVAAKLAEQGMAVGLFVAGSALLGSIVFAVRSPRVRIATGLGAGALWAALETLALGRVSIAVWIVMLGWGALVALAGSLRVGVEEQPERRRALRALGGGIVTLSAVLLGISALTRRGGRAVVARTSPLRARTSGPAASPSQQVLAQRIAPVHGTRKELTPNEDFYRIDINLAPPRIDAATWRLDIGGLVDRPAKLTLDELRAMPSVSQIITLECISNRVGGDLIGTSLWTGVRLAEVLRRAGVRDTAAAVHIRAADGFYESVAAPDIRDERTLLVYAMNDEPLADVHGFPLRIYVPNRHGMKLPKWITHIVAADHDGPGYWVDRGWSKDAIPHTTSVIDTVGMSMRIGDARVVPVGGIAYAGARGISKVEVQVDDGPWNAATLIAPPLGPLTWVMWRYDAPYERGKHTFRVRAYDGTGALQATREEPPHPDGATGLHSLTTHI